MDGEFDVDFAAGQCRTGDERGVTKCGANIAAQARSISETRSY